MQTDLVNLCLMAVIALAGFALASRQMGRGRGYPRGGTTGGQTPRGGGRGGRTPSSSDDSYIGGRPRGELFPPKDDR